MNLMANSVLQDKHDKKDTNIEHAIDINLNDLFKSEFPEVIASGKIKARVEDFLVSEIKGFDLTGDGQHLCLLIEKKNLNTQDALNILADFFHVPRKTIGYLGLKDKHALTKQWFSVDLAESDFDENHLENFNEFFLNKMANDKRFSDCKDGHLPEMKIVESQRNRKKLHIGSLTGNYFEVIVRDIESIIGDEMKDSLEKRLQAIKDRGFANYFGEQRFGKDFSNLKELNSFERLNLSRNRTLRSRILSTLRAYAFNHYLSERIKANLMRVVMPGDVVQFSDGKTLFKVKDDIQSIQQRVDQAELVITGSLLGCNQSMASQGSLQFEERALESFSRFSSLAARFKLMCDRRPLFVVPKDFSWKFLNDSGLSLHFELPAGAYATSLVREVFLITENES